jgi:hypothetical protein
MNETNELATVVVKLLKNGDLTIEEEGNKIVVAHYNRASGHLEWATREYSVKLYQQACSVIGTINKGKEESGLVIRTISIKGETKGAPKALPDELQGKPSGDSDYEVVKWYLDNDPQQAVHRYGIYLDDKGEFIRRDAKREVNETIDARDVDDDNLPWVQEGSKTQSRTPIRQARRVITAKKAIIARRGTNEGPDGEEPLTFTPNEVVGKLNLQVPTYERATAAKEDEA